MQPGSTTARAATFTLYRFYAEDDSLLYVGLTINPGRRMEKHASEKPWWADVSRIAMEQHPSLDALRAAERVAIQTEKPLHNIRMNGGRGQSIPQSHPKTSAALEGLVGRHFHSWRPERLDDSEYATKRGGMVLEWQGRVVDRAEDGLYIVELYSWWDGCPNGQRLVHADAMVSWTFYDSALEMQVLLGCREADPGRCGGEVTHYFDRRETGFGLHLLCSGCVEKYPGYRNATALRWISGKPVIK